MYISEVEISNFRSIKNSQIIKFEKIGAARCFILLGINEAGKSNVLRAISALDKSAKIQYSVDCNAEAEEAGDAINVFFKIETRDPQIFIDRLTKAGLDDELTSKVHLNEVYRGIEVRKSSRDDYYHVGVPDHKVYANYVVVGEEIQKRTVDNLVFAEDGTAKNVLTQDKFSNYLEKQLRPSFDKNIPKVVFWRSSAEYRITGKVNLEAFKDNTTESITLRNCFRIAGFEDDAAIKLRIESALGNPAKTASLRQILSEKVTSHINEVWREHKVGVSFQIDGNELSFLVEDKDNDIPKFVVEQRSDGFKHFISILLNLSAESKTGNIKDYTILLDEPETHLHPSGQRFLRDELMRIAADNVVIYATHSIFMVDTKHLERHFSIRKKNGATNVEQIDRDNPYQEEVLFEALGTSALQLIEPNVLVVEGKTDRDIFKLFSRKFSKEIKPPNVSAISADSADRILNYVKFINKKIVRGYVLVDSDEEGQRIKAVVQKEVGYDKNNSFEINDLYKVKPIATLEDLFEKSLVEQAALESLGLTIVLDPTGCFCKQVSAQMQVQRKPFRDEQKEEFKKAFFQIVLTLKKATLQSQPYYKFFETLCSKISRQ